MTSRTRILAAIAASVYAGAILQAQTPPVVANGTAEPAQIRIGVRTTVRFFADISSPNLVPGSVNLQRIGAAGTNPVVVGNLNDDGANGDEIAGDGRYSVALTLNEAAASVTTYVITGAIRNQIVRPRSANIVVAAVNNRAPVAIAGPGRGVRTGTATLLDGRGSFDLDGQLLTFAWSFLSRPNGSNASFDNAGFVKPSFTPDVAGTYRVGLIVNDGVVNSAVSEVLIQASASNGQPTAVIGGALQLPFGPGATSTNQLNAASSSDPENGPLTYSWRLVSRPASSTAPQFAPLTSATPTLTADKPGRYVVELIVNDGAAPSVPVQATVIFYRPNTPPSVNAGPDQPQTSTAAVNLTGTATDVDGSIAARSWAFISRPAGSSAVLQNSSTLTPSFTPDANGDYLVEFTATDNLGVSSSARVVIRKSPAPSQNVAPVVSAGAAQTIVLPATAALSATATDDGLPAPPGAMTFAWSLVSGPAAVIFSNPNSRTTTATFHTTGVHVLRFTANDGASSSSSDVAITVNDTGPVLPAIQNRTISLGTTLRFRLAAISHNLAAALNYGLPTAPAGAILNPSPVIDWTPTASQIGTHAFTARVSDGQGRSDTKSFQVTVVQSNRAPVLAAQADASLTAGSLFTRTLTATDPDAGNTVTFGLVSGPSGMTLTGANLNWTVAGQSFTTVPVTVRVTDQAGATDVKKFNISILASAPPVAVNDSYTARVGQMLTVPAPSGVLANDVSPLGQAMTATKASDPAIGSLGSFAADGSFAFLPPPVLPGPVFRPVVKTLISSGVLHSFQPIVADVTGDGKAEMLMAYLNNSLRVFREDGSVLWDISRLNAPNNDCFLWNFSVQRSPMAVGDVDDDGLVEVVVHVACERDGKSRLAALNGLNGTAKWVSGTLADDVTAIGTVWYASPTIARLGPAQTPSIVIGLSGGAVDGSDCNFIKAASGLQFCNGVIAVNGSDGSVRMRGIANAPVSRGDRKDQNIGLHAPIVADLNRDGNVEVVYGAAVFSATGALLQNNPDWPAAEFAIANLDDSPDIEVVRSEYRGNFYRRLAVYKANGSLLWQMPLPVGFYGAISIADIDGSGRPSIVFAADYAAPAEIWAVSHQGAVKWIYPIPNDLGGRSFSRPGIFDLDGDGSAEIIVGAVDKVYFLDGINGRLKHAFDIAAATGVSGGGNTSYLTQFPVVADIEGSGHARVIVPWKSDTFTAAGGVLVLRNETDNWRPVRKLLNQFVHFPGNINDNGSVPAFPSPGLFTTPANNQFGGAQPPIGSIPDPRTRYTTSFTYTANAGGLGSNAATVSIDIAPLNRPPVFTSTAPTRYVINGAFQYNATAIDPDPGDIVTYTLRGNSGNPSNDCSIGSSTGFFRCNVIQGDSFLTGAAFVLTATDSQGESAIQTLNLTTVTGTSVVPNVIGLSQAAASSSLAGSGFATGAVSQVSSATIAIGSVISQSPSGGSTVPSGEQVALTVSSGPGPVAVPFVGGQALTLANTTLTAARFTVNVTRVFSNTVPANTVISQSPAAGTVIQPIPANPVTLIVSSGNGLQLRLNRPAITADQNITVIPQAFDANGNPAALPSLTYAIVDSFGGAVGPLPTIAGTTISVGTATRGVFRVTAADAANSRTASAEFSVMAPRVSGEAGNDESFVRLLETLEAVHAFRPQLAAALAANNVALMQTLLRQMVTTWRNGVDLDDLKLSFPVSPDNGFPLTAAELTARGMAATPSDLLIQQILLDACDDIQAFTDGLRAQPTTLTQLRALADQFSTRAARLDGLTVSDFGTANSRREYRRLLSRRIPAFYEALMEELAQLSGLGRRQPRFPAFGKSALQPATLEGEQLAEPALSEEHTSPFANGAKAAQGQGPLESTLAEVLVTQAVQYIVDKIMDEGSKTYKNAKEFASAIHQQAAWSSMVMVTRGLIKDTLSAGDITEVVSGASLSFRVFNEPTPNQGIIEVDTDVLDPRISTTIIIGPDFATGVATEINNLKEAFSYQQNPAANPKKARNLRKAKDLVTKLYGRIVAIGDATTALQKLRDGAFQDADQGMRGCIFSASPTCNQLIYNNGFDPAYRYAPPDGFSSLTGLPVPIIFVVMNDEGAPYFGTPVFFPAPPEP